jgi:hypothetical protein
MVAFIRQNTQKITMLSMNLMLFAEVLVKITKSIAIKNTSTVIMTNYLQEIPKIFVTLTT